MHIHVQGSYLWFSREDEVVVVARHASKAEEILHPVTPNRAPHNIRPIVANCILSMLEVTSKWCTGC